MRDDRLTHCHEDFDWGVLPRDPPSGVSEIVWGPTMPMQIMRHEGVAVVDQPCPNEYLERSQHGTPHVASLFDAREVELSGVSSTTKTRFSDFSNEDVSETMLVTAGLSVVILQHPRLRLLSVAEQEILRLDISLLAFASLKDLCISFAQHTTRGRRHLDCGWFRRHGSNETCSGNHPVTFNSEMEAHVPVPRLLVMST